MTDQVQPTQTATTTTPAPAPSGNGTGTAKKSNTCLIIAIIVLVLLVLGGVGGYFAYRYAKNKVKNAIDTATTSTGTLGTTTTTTSSNSDQEVENNYNNAKAVTATGTLGTTYSAEIGGILTPIYGGAKVSEWTDLSGSGYLTFLVPRKITAADFATLENAFIAKGYSKSYNDTTSTDISISFSNSSVEIMVSCTVGEATVGATVTQTTE